MEEILMSLIEKFKTYTNDQKLYIPYIIAITGIVLAPFIHYSWIVTIIACLFIKEE